MMTELLEGSYSPVVLIRRRAYNADSMLYKIYCITPRTGYFTINLAEHIVSPHQCLKILLIKK